MARNCAEIGLAIKCEGGENTVLAADTAETTLAGDSRLLSDLLHDGVDAAQTGRAPCAAYTSSSI